MGSTFSPGTSVFEFNANCVFKIPGVVPVITLIAFVRLSQLYVSTDLIKNDENIMANTLKMKAPAGISVSNRET